MTPPVLGAGVFAEPPGAIAIPVVFNADYYTGAALLKRLAAGPVVATVEVIIEVQNVDCDNVIAQTTWGNKDKVFIYSLQFGQPC